MDFFANPGKNVEIQVKGDTYLRHAIRTRFLEVGDSYLDFIKEFASPHYEQGDILSISEKIIALSQKRVIYKRDVKPGFWANNLSKFVMKTPAGFSVGNPYKMQVAIMLCGLPKVIYAAILGFFGKLVGRRGVFYEIVGPEVSVLDGFYGEAYKVYADMGILNPIETDEVCEEIKEQLNMDCMIVDANDLGVEILGKSKSVTHSIEDLKSMIKDNPSGQSNQQTPLILIRKHNS